MLASVEVEATIAFNLQTETLRLCQEVL